VPDEQGGRVLIAARAQHPQQCIHGRAVNIRLLDDVTARPHCIDNELRRLASAHGGRGNDAVRGEAERGERRAHQRRVRLPARGERPVVVPERAVASVRFRVPQHKKRLHLIPHPGPYPLLTSNK
jgi:hypothetical protein